jgi:chromosome segregation ATPase
MHRKLAVMTAALVLGAAFAAAVHAEEDAGGARVREMLRRTQEALRQAQSDNAELARGKADAEQKLKAAAAQAAAAEGSAKSTATTLGAKLASAESARTDLEKKYGSAREELAATGSKLGETTRELNARNAELAALKQNLEVSNQASASCEAKNVTLFGYAEEILQRYKDKGVLAAMAQKEPVFGLREVAVENVVQEYRLKLASQKVKP